MAKHIIEPIPVKLPSNPAVRAIKAYYIDLCHELGLDPRTGKQLRKKIAHARQAVHDKNVTTAKIS